jgi:DNA processing protein
VSIVGTRKATAYGERVTRELAGAFARAGATVVSGMARGIDSVGHRAALEEGAPTVAVLGTGIDVPYPVAHRALHAAIARYGAVISEYPPGVHSTRYSFPHRNRIIAALSPLTIVVEAGVKSGAEHTATHALDLGRALAAVPGPIDSPQSEGTNNLLRDGAHVIASVADALGLLGLEAPVRRSVARSLSGDDLALWNALAHGPADVDTLAARSRLPARRCLAAVSSLEIEGLVECALTGEIRRR